MSTEQRVCPLDGGPARVELHLAAPFMVCNLCAEILHPHELVRHASRGTRRHYIAAMAS